MIVIFWKVFLEGIGSGYSTLFVELMRAIKMGFSALRCVQWYRWPIYWSKRETYAKDRRVLSWHNSYHVQKAGFSISQGTFQLCTYNAQFFFVIWYTFINTSCKSLENACAIMQCMEFIHSRRWAFDWLDDELLIHKFLLFLLHSCGNRVNGRVSLDLPKPLSSPLNLSRLFIVIDPGNNSFSLHSWLKRLLDTKLFHVEIAV